MHNNIDDFLFNQAVGFLSRHWAEHLDGARELLLSRATEHLMEINDLSRSRASGVALRAWAEIESARTPACIDLSHTTSSLLVVHDRTTGTRKAISVAAVMDLLQRAERRLPPPRVAETTTH